MRVSTYKIGPRRALRLSVVAEGVDSEDQANYLRLTRCDEMQGYFISRPVPRESITAMLRAKKAAPAG